MKKIITIMAAIAVLTTVTSVYSQSIDYGMIGGFVQSPSGVDLPASSGGFLLLGVTPSSGFNPIGASLSDILNSANMLSVTNSFATIDSGAPGQLYIATLPTQWSTGDTIAVNTQLYVLASTSGAFDLSAPWVLITGSSWLSPDPNNPLAAISIEMSLVNNVIVSAGFGGAGVGAYFNTPGTTTSPGDANLVMVPEPATYALLAMGAVAMGGYMIRRRQRG